MPSQILRRLRPGTTSRPIRIYETKPQGKVGVAISKARSIIGGEVGHNALNTITRLGAVGLGLAAVGAGAGYGAKRVGEGVSESLKDVGLQEKSPEELVQEDVNARRTAQDYIDERLRAGGFPPGVDPRIFLGDQLYKGATGGHKQMVIDYKTVLLALAGLSTAALGVYYFTKGGKR